MNTLKELTWPYKIQDDDTLFHLGRKADGGYVLNKKTIDNIELCYSYGVGEEVSFENDLMGWNKNIAVHLYDHTVNAPQSAANMAFHKEGLSGIKEQDLDSFFVHLEKNEHNLSQKILLKLDAETAEYSLFNHHTIDKFATLPAMIIEFHEVNSRIENFIKIISDINKYFKIIHIHANNCSFMFDYNGFAFPITPEITFVNSKLFNLTERVNLKYPIENLDFRNSHTFADLQIDFTK